MEPVKTGVIGVGMMGFSQIRNCFEPLPDYEVTAVCDIYEPNIKRVMDYFERKQKKIPVYRDYKQMLKEADFELAVIVTPDYLHAEMAEACLLAGKHIRLEKPVATTMEGVKRVMDIWREHKECIVQVGYELRYSNTIQKMQKELKGVGTPKMLWCHEFRHPFLKKEGPVPDWIRQKKYSGGTLLEKNCHHFDLFNMIADAKPVSVYASGDNLVEYKEYDVLDNAFVIVEYENGVRASLSLSMFCPELKGQKNMHALSFGVIGEQGNMELRDDTLYFWDRESKSEQEYTYLRNNFEAHSEDIIPSLEELAHCIRSQKQPFTDLYVGLKSTMVSLAAEKSAQEKRVVTIEEMERLSGINYEG